MKQALIKGCGSVLPRYAVLTPSPHPYVLSQELRSVCLVLQLPRSFIRGACCEA